MKAWRAFTLAEVMISVLFVSIALFAYIGLDLRLMVSSGKLQERQVQREIGGQEMVAAVATAAARSSGVSGVPGGPPGLRQVTVVKTWTDRNGQQSVRFDTWVREVNAAW